MERMDPVVHFEMPYEQADRLVTFYSGVFGWQMYQFGEEMGKYIHATTTETDEDRMPLKAGAIGGGFFPKGLGRLDIPSVVIAVEDIRASMEKVIRAGGTVSGEPVEIPGIGLFVPITDTEGNQVGLLQTIPDTGF